MKYNSCNNTTAIFCEQLETVTDLYEKWSDCERTVVICALLKRLPYSCLKFIQSFIDASFAQCNCTDQLQTLEQHSNSKTFLTNLCDLYKTLTSCNHSNDVQLNKDSIFYTESDSRPLGLELNSSFNSNLNLQQDRHNKKEEILNDILTCMPMLKIGNDDAKQAYLSIIPYIVEDARRGTVNTSIVQHILTFLLIHPAISTDERRSLNQYKRYLEESIMNRMNANSDHPITNWQTIAPPISTGGHQHHSTSSLSSISSSQKSHPQLHLKSNENLWDSQSVHVSQDYIDTIEQAPPTQPSSNQTGFMKTVGKHMEFKPIQNLFESTDCGTDDHHVSFSKNGTEILDFDGDSDKSNTQIAYCAMTPLNDFLTVPNLVDHGAIKTRRSNSLTTATATKPHEQLTAIFTASSENLTQLPHKPRSFSLSMESPRSSVTSSGSETRLDDFKPSYQTFQTHQIGMSNIAQWLKSLRLHKYVWIFQNITYDQMMDITEEYLNSLDVTKGARHKLVLCIQKLKDRYNILSQLEKNLLAGSVTVMQVLEEMTNIVMTPMKPVELYNKEDVAAQFLKVLDLVCNIITTKQIVPQDEDAVNSLVWILEKAVHNEAFVTHTNQLKENRFKVSKLKIKFPPKGHYNKNGGTASNGNSNKSRWPSSSKNHNKGNGNGGNGDNKPHRKNSNPLTNFNYQQQQQQQQQQQKNNKQMYSSVSTTNYHSGQTQSGSMMCYNKSSSYPNFMGSGGGINGSAVNITGQHHPPQQQQHQHQQPQHQPYHRHSVSNLITLTPSHSTATTIAAQPSTAITHPSIDDSHTQLKAANQNGQRSSSSGGGVSTVRSGAVKQTINKNNIGDINSRLEFLCLQMTEQAIN